MVYQTFYVNKISKPSPHLLPSGYRQTDGWGRKGSRGVGGRADHLHQVAVGSPPLPTLTPIVPLKRPHWGRHVLLAYWALMLFESVTHISKLYFTQKSGFEVLAGEKGGIWPMLALHSP